MWKTARPLILAIALLLPLSVQPQLPQTLHYQGYLTSNVGAPVNGATQLTFKLYNVASGGSVLWSETHASVNVANGNYQVILGNATPFGLDFGAQYWLGVSVGTDAEMAPRQALTMVPYAFRAVVTDSLAPSATVQGSQIAGNIAGAQVTGTISSATIAGSTLTGLDTRYVQALGNTITTVDAAGNVGEYNSLAIGADGLPVISYYQRTSGGIAGRLKVAKCANAACTTGTVSVVETGIFDPETGEGIGGVGQFSSIAVGGDGLPVISYYAVPTGGADGRLKVAKCGNAACTGASTITTVDADGHVGWDTSIAIGEDGFPVISYVDFGSLALKVAKCVDAACQDAAIIRTLGVVDSPGLGTSIAIGSDGRPVVSYTSPAGGPGTLGLKVARCGLADCSDGGTFNQVDAQVGVGRFSSLAIGADGVPVIAYQGVPGMRVAKCFNVDCAQKIQITTVDSSSGVQYTSIASRHGEWPVIAYYDSDNGDLRVAKCASASCAGSIQRTAVDSAGDVGTHASMAFGADGLPVISYYDVTNGDLKVVKCVNQACAPWQ